mmetsp:Transcript_78323/g.254418  ORF Transcript_78323/g.254418 Transcript_78323/m.254418 type:complete len:819 (-) Transcript_78323:361-2817(-)
MQHAGSFTGGAPARHMHAAAAPHPHTQQVAPWQAVPGAAGPRPGHGGSHTMPVATACQAPYGNPAQVGPCPSARSSVGVHRPAAVLTQAHHQQLHQQQSHQPHLAAPHRPTSPRAGMQGGSMSLGVHGGASDGVAYGGAQHRAPSVGAAGYGMPEQSHYHEVAQLSARRAYHPDHVQPYAGAGAACRSGSHDGRAPALHRQPPTPNGAAAAAQVGYEPQASPAEWLNPQPAAPYSPVQTQHRLVNGGNGTSRDQAAAPMSVHRARSPASAGGSACLPPTSGGGSMNARGPGASAGGSRPGTGGGDRGGRDGGRSTPASPPQSRREASPRPSPRPEGGAPQRGEVRRQGEHGPGKRPDGGSLRVPIAGHGPTARAPASGVRPGSVGLPVPESSDSCSPFGGREESWSFSGAEPCLAAGMAASAEEHASRAAGSVRVPCVQEEESVPTILQNLGDLRMQAEAVLRSRETGMGPAAAAAAAASALRSPWAQVAMSRGVAAYIVPSPSAQFAQPASATPPSRHMSIPPTPDLGCCSAGVVFGSMGQMCHMAHMAHIGHTGHMGMSKELAPPLPAMRTMPPVHTPYIPSAAHNFATCLPPAPLDSPQVVGLAGSWPCGSSRSGTEASGKVGLRQPKSAPCLSEVANAFNDLAFWSQSGIGHEARLPSPRDGCSPTLLEGSDEASDEAGSWHGEGPLKEPQVSVGSSSHGNSKCKPCAFYHKKGCDAGFGCLFCHICEPGEKKRRRQQQRTTIKLRRVRREARLAEEAEQGHVEEACAPDTSAAGLVRGFDTTDGLVGHLAAQEAYNPGLVGNFITREGVLVTC